MAQSNIGPLDPVALAAGVEAVDPPSEGQVASVNQHGCSSRAMIQVAKFPQYRL